MTVRTTLSAAGLTIRPWFTTSLYRRQIVAGDVASVFAFFKDPTNLPSLMPPYLNVQVTWKSDEVLRAGSIVRSRFSIFGLSRTVESVISRYEDGVRFTDEQLKGPFRRWVHSHEFRQVDSGVEVIDHVHYELPFGPVGLLADLLLARWQLRHMFGYRAIKLAEMFSFAAPERGSSPS